MIGNILLTLAFAAGVFSLIMYFFTFKGYTNTKTYARLGYHIFSISVVAASALLLYAILTHQYQYKYVFNYSNSDLSLGLLMSTFYAGQEGSFMLWLFFTAIVGLILLDYSSKHGDLEPRVMMVFSLAASFLALMVNPMRKSPFNYIWTESSFLDIKYFNQALLSSPVLQNFLFQDPNSNQTFVKVSQELHSTLNAAGISFGQFLIKGKGLNPLLQNFWMQIHPPMLFLGFSMSTAPFAFAFAALLKNDYKEWVKPALPWVLSGMGILGLAIMLGGYWAYGVLGWGGYWGWDPVENSSLVPWLIGVASIHTLLVQKKTQDSGKGSRFVRTNLILSIMTYVLVLYSTFLTRSGILGDSSVHSFVDPGMLVYLLLIAFVISFTALGFGMIAYRWKYLSEKFEFEEDLLSRELALFTGAVTLISAGLIIFVGTSAPIFGQTVETRFYDELNLPIGILIGLINGFSLLLKWKRSDGRNLRKQMQKPLGLSVVATAVILILGGTANLMLSIFTFSSAFAMIINSEIAYKIVKKRLTNSGAYVAHVGIALFMLGVIATGGFSEESQLNLAKGVPTEAFGRTLTFTGYTPIDGGKKYKFNVEIDNDGSKSVVSPVMYIAEFNNSLMREPDILNKVVKDFYISPLSYDDKGGGSQKGGKKATLTKGNSTDFKGRTITFSAFNFPQDAMSAMMSGGSFSIGAELEVAYKSETYKVEPKLVSSGGSNRKFEGVDVKEADLRIDLANLDASGRVDLVFSELSGGDVISQPQEILAVEASVKPFINLVWLGVILMTTGFFIAVVRRSKESLA